MYTLLEINSRMFGSNNEINDFHEMVYLKRKNRYLNDMNQNHNHGFNEKDECNEFE